MRTLLCALALLSTAQVAPMTLSWQARVLDNGGAPVHGDGHAVVVSLWSSETSTELVDRLFTESFADAHIDNGFLSLHLGSGDTLDSGVLDQPAVWVELSVDGGEIGPRTLLSTVPRAARSLETERIATTTADCATTADHGRVRFTGGTVEACLPGGW